MAHTHSTQAVQGQSSYAKLLDWAEFNRFSFIVISLLIPSCIGGLAAGAGAINDTPVLAMLVILTIMNQAFLLAVAPMKLLVPSFLISTGFNTLMLIAYSFFL
jgi:hypothetical protein